MFNFMNSEPFLYVVGLVGPADGLPYTPPEIGEVDRVITNLTCVYNYSCTMEVIDGISCDSFNGIAVLTCLTCKSKNSSEWYFRTF